MVGRNSCEWRDALGIVGSSPISPLRREQVCGGFDVLLTAFCLYGANCSGTMLMHGFIWTGRVALVPEGQMSIERHRMMTFSVSWRDIASFASGIA